MILKMIETFINQDKLMPGYNNVDVIKNKTIKTFNVLSKRSNRSYNQKKLMRMNSKISCNYFNNWHNVGRGE